MRKHFSQSILRRGLRRDFNHSKVRRLFSQSEYRFRSNINLKFCMHTKINKTASRLTSEMKRVILDMFAKGLSTVRIARVLKTMSGYTITRQGLLKFWKRQENLVTASRNNGGKAC